MKKRIPLLARAILLVLPLVMLLSWLQAGKSAREFYQITVYHFSNAGQEKVLNDYLQNALLPALHRSGIIRIAVLKAFANDTTKD